MKILMNQNGDGGGGTYVMPEWAAGFPDEIKPTMQAKNWKTPVDMATSFAALNRMVGNHMERPKPEWGPDKWGEYWKAGGRPDKPEEYEWDQDLIKQSPVPIAEDKIKEWNAELHRQGLSKAQAKAITSRYLKNEFDEIAKHQQAEKVAREAAELKLRTDWGAKYEDNLKASVAALEKVTGADWNDLKTFLNAQGLGNHPAIFKMGFHIASKLSEDRTFSGAGSAPDTGVEAAKSEIKKLQADKEFMEIYLNGTGDKHREALERMRKLHVAAAGMSNTPLKGATA